MNEEIEYAEMLEIPVSTVNVVKKKNRRVRGKNQPNLKERLISRVNNRVGNASYAPEDAAIESAPASALEQNPIYASAENAAMNTSVPLVRRRNLRSRDMHSGMAAFFLVSP